MCGNPFYVMRRADARPTDAVSHPHRISAVGPEQGIHGEEVREDATELKIFKILNTFQLISEHIISLRESFQTQSTSRAILPKMISLANGQLYGKVAQVCWGIIKGFAYLHKHCIAHGDIKPENLVVDTDYCLKIIDFDAATKINDEDRWSMANVGRRVGCARDGDVDAQPDQGRPVVYRASSSLSSKRV